MSNISLAKTCLTLHGRARYDDIITRRVCGSMLCMLLSTLCHDDMRLLMGPGRDDGDRIVERQEAGEYLLQLVKKAGDWSILFSPLVSARSVQRMHSDVMERLQSDLQRRRTSLRSCDVDNSNNDVKSDMIALAACAWQKMGLAETVVCRIQKCVDAL